MVDCGIQPAYATKIYGKSVLLCVRECPKDAPFTKDGICIADCTDYVTETNVCKPTCDSKHWYYTTVNGE